MVRHFFSQGVNVNINANTNFSPQSLSEPSGPIGGGDMQYQDFEIMEFQDFEDMDYEE